MASKSDSQQTVIATPDRKGSSPARVMVVLGGNAFAVPGRPLTMDRQFEVAGRILRNLTPLFAGDRPVVITHGNGPQVGHMLTRVAAAANNAYDIPLGVCVAESEGELGYILQQTLHNVLANAGLKRQVASLLTQIVVDRNDPAFDSPTKAVGPILTTEKAGTLRAQGICTGDDSGKGLRRLVPSPRPLEIIETDVIRGLLDANVLAACAGGGGIPVIRKGRLLHGVDAVVDKDPASALLGEQLGATEMLIITDVSHACERFRTESQQAIETIDVAAARQLILEDHFASGSMLPEIEAARRFCERPGTRAVICSPDNLIEALAGDSGTVIVGPDFSSNVESHG